MSKQYEVPKYDPKKLEILSDLRRENELTLTEVAVFFGMSDRNAVSRWETGMSKPHSTKRNHFIRYLLGKLLLRLDTEQFLAIWNDVMVGEWKWKPLSDDEWWQYLPSTKQLESNKPTRPFLAPSRPVYDLVGRDKLLDDLKQQLLAGGSLALSALEGMPGVGKTALAVELAHDPEILAHFKDGVLWAGLGREPDVLALFGTWAIALGKPTDKKTIEERQALLRIAIGQRHMLLVVDDAWQPEDALAFQVGGNNCAYLLTTRYQYIALDFAGERVSTVRELEDEDGLKLLKKLASTVVKTEPEAAEELVKAVGNLPLALILMGRYLQKEAHSRQPRRLRASLARLRKVEERLALQQPQKPLGHFPALAADAPLSLLAAITLSDEALDDNVAQRTLYALSVFPPKPNTFSEQAAEAVAAAPIETLDKLNDSGLLESMGEGRHTLHQTIADYARLKLTDQKAYGRMVTFFVNYVETHENDYKLLDQEINNILAMLDVAFNREMKAELVRGGNVFWRYLDTRGLYTLAETHLDRVQQATRALNDIPNLTTTLLNLGTALVKSGKPTQAEECFEEGLKLAQEVEHQENIIALKISLGSLAGNRGDYDQAKKYFQEALELARDGQYRDRVCDLLQNLGTIAILQGEYSQAEEYLREARDIAIEIDYKTRLSALLSVLASLEDKRGNKDQAKQYLLEGLNVAQELGYQESIALIYANLGALAINQENYTLAEEYLLAGLPIAEKIEHTESRSRILRNLGEVKIKLRDYQQAEECLEKALALAREIKHRLLIYTTLVQRGELFFQQQQWNRAFIDFREAQDMAQKVNDQEITATALYGLARIAVAQGNIHEGRRLGEESLGKFKAINHDKATEVTQWLDTLPPIEQEIG